MSKKLFLVHNFYYNLTNMLMNNRKFIHIARKITNEKTSHISPLFSPTPLITSPLNPVSSYFLSVYLLHLAFYASPTFFPWFRIFVQTLLTTFIIIYWNIIYQLIKMHFNWSEMRTDQVKQTKTNLLMREFELSSLEPMHPLVKCLLGSQILI